MLKATESLNGRQKIQVAERAAVGLRTVDRYLAGKTRPNTDAHVERALRELALDDLIRPRHRRNP